MQLRPVCSMTRELLIKSISPIIRSNVNQQNNFIIYGVSSRRNFATVLSTSRKVRKFISFKIISILVWWSSSHLKKYLK
jgi:hypothetical protein